MSRSAETDPRKVLHYTDLQRSKPTRQEDPYQYQAGWGNRFQSEIIPGALPVAQNNPQDRGFGLYTEGFTSSSFAAPRNAHRSAYLYRARPSAAHNGYSDIQTRSHVESCFLSINKNLQTLPQLAEWSPFPIPDANDATDFIDGLHTLGGSGDANLGEGLAIHIYAFNADMRNKAYCNTDGEFLITPQLGTLDIQTEMGMLFVQPGEICVIPRGVNFRMAIANGATAARGYITEIWGSVWELPDLGPLGGYALANARDFLYPVAHIDEDLMVPYTIVVKTNGKLVAISQDHSPFDVVAWHGNVCPYKYDLTKFSSQNSTSVDHTDPSIFTVLQAKSRDPNTALAEYLWFGPRWDMASNSFRPPYFHRNAASEFLGCIYGAGLGRGNDFVPGAASYDSGFTAHGSFADEMVEELALKVNVPRKILMNQMTFMIESSRTLLFTKWARQDCGVFDNHSIDPQVWKKLPDRFSTNPEVRKLLQRRKEEAEKEIERLNYYHNVTLLDTQVKITTKA
ncbi:hypothetical protein CDD81_2034 [Ophiocordyceps australis]|uniref:homogentisate 1,2-dioxygenase n=1 Tax=Ophiocordyceps australis TaxID=1399860 RepID=A0A2C5XB53_9HYPO|nr:hypothetical protein CDD81_2034 [Ophiocordyceps australis]